jgi:hypothetical protein
METLFTEVKTTKQYERHGMSRTPEYQAFQDAKRRCTDPDNPDYKNYGGEGIRFLFDSFTEFIETLGKRPEGMSLDRIDSSGDYCAENVRWAFPVQQARNRKSNKLTSKLVAELKGLHAAGTMGRKRLAKRFNIDPTTVRDILKGRIWRDVLPEPPTIDPRVLEQLAGYGTKCRKKRVYRTRRKPLEPSKLSKSFLKFLAYVTEVQ